MCQTIFLWLIVLYLYLICEQLTKPDHMSPSRKASLTLVTEHQLHSHQYKVVYSLCMVTICCRHGCWHIFNYNIVHFKVVVVIFWAYLYKCGESGARHNKWTNYITVASLAEPDSHSLAPRQWHHIFMRALFTFVSARGGWVWQVEGGARNLRHSLTRMQLRSQTVRSAWSLRSQFQSL